MGIVFCAMNPCLAVSDLIPDALVTHYGPLAFGVALLVVVWKVIIGPELEERREMIETFATTMERASNMATAGKMAAEASERAAQASERAAESLRISVERLEQYEQRSKE